ncbi:MAG: hypothetical protein IKT62_01855 [Firmicutes bacterium]|nr:hypothetical protein [Bacillota bacterium]
MNKVYISHLADKRIKDYLVECGHQLVEVIPRACVDPAINCHPDIYMCHLASLKALSAENYKNLVFHGDSSRLAYDYPGHAIYNGCSTGKYFIHNFKITDCDLLKAVEDSRLIKVHVQQGYAKCSCIPVDEDSIITSDRGIAKSIKAAGLEVLIIEPGQVILEGYPYGFIGGASGKIGDTIIFNGDLSAHTDYLSIKDFIESRGLNIKYFKEYPLTDIGSIICE